MRNNSETTLLFYISMSRYRNCSKLFPFRQRQRLASRSHAAVHARNTDTFYANHLCCMLVRNCSGESNCVLNAKLFIRMLKKKSKEVRSGDFGGYVTTCTTSIRKLLVDTLSWIISCGSYLQESDFDTWFAYFRKLTCPLFIIISMGHCNNLGKNISKIYYIS